MTTLPPSAARRARRFAEQRWLLDAVIQTVGLQWDQGRIGYSEGPCGFLAEPDFERVRSHCPYLAVGSEDDELTALEPTFALLDDIAAPKELVLLQGERHTLDKKLASKSVNELTYIADWFADCLAGASRRAC